MAWTETWTGEIEGIAAEPNGIVYAGTTRGMARSYGSSGDERWTYETGAGVESVAVAGGAIYAGCVDGSTHRIDAHSAAVVSVATDTAGGGAVYSGDGSGTVRCHGDDTGTASKLTTDGEEVWFRDVGDDVKGAGVGPSGSVYLNGDKGQAVAGYSADGDRQWHYTGHSRGLEAMAVAVAPDGTDVIWSGDNGGHVSELDGDRNERWFADVADDQIDAMDADAAGNLYVGAGSRVIKVTERAWSGGDAEESENAAARDDDVEARLRELGIDPELTTAELVTLARNAGPGADDVEQTGVPRRRRGTARGRVGQRGRSDGERRDAGHSSTTVGREFISESVTVRP